MWYDLPKRQKCTDGSGLIPGSVCVPRRSMRRSGVSGLIHAGMPPSGTVALEGVTDAGVCGAAAGTGLAGVCANATDSDAAAHVARINFLSNIHLSWLVSRNESDQVGQ